jgi:hypothetical protein
VIRRGAGADEPRIGRQAVNAASAATSVAHLLVEYLNRLTRHPCLGGPARQWLPRISQREVTTEAFSGSTPVLSADAAGSPSPHSCGSIDAEGGPRVTFIWFVIWLVANNIGGHEPPELNPVNAWTATLILGIALDLGRAGGVPGRGTSHVARAWAARRSLWPSSC